MGIGKLIIFIGVILIIAGIFLTFIGKIKWLGCLPGDVLMKKNNFTFYFPFTSGLLISFILSLLFLIFSRK